MFVKVYDTNYFIADAKNKTVKQIFTEVFTRMNKSFVSEQEKRNIYSQITDQILEQKTVDKRHQPW